MTGCSGSNRAGVRERCGGKGWASGVTMSQSSAKDPATNARLKFLSGPGIA